MPARPKGSLYPLKFPCGCIAGYFAKHKGKKKLVKHRNVMILKGHDDGRRVCNHGKTWRLDSVWIEVTDGK